MKPLTAAGVTVAAFLMTQVPHVAGQAVPLEQVNVAVAVDSGLVVNTGTRRAVIFSTVIEVPDASWIRLTFDQALLGGGATVLKMTGLQDGAVQHHTAETLRQWRDTSAYFNGNAVKIELVSDPREHRSRIVIRRVLIGPPGDGGIASQCGPTDDRLPSSDPRVARTSPGGCTAWMIADAENCFFTAGHCYSVSGLQICEFNVPLSNSNGSWNHPPPADQYAVDHASAQFVNGGIGNDWSYFGCFANTETGLTAFQAQGDAFDLAATPPPVDGQTIRVTGHGTDSSPSSWNQIQQTHTGPYTDFIGSTIKYQVDTTGGSSGSPVINEDTGQAIGVHTNAGCNSAGGGANQGTGINNTGLQAALANPEGICIPTPGLEYAFPNGLPEFLDPAGDTILMQIASANGGTLDPDTPTLHFTAGGGFQAVPMSPAGGDFFEALFPSIECGTLVRFFFSAETTEGEVVFNPLLAPSEVYTAISGVSQESVFIDDFESDLDWSVSAAGGLTDGQWEREVPISNDICDRGNPGSDADGSGVCFLTDNDPATCNSDVDNGSTILTSPLMDASNGTPFISYWRWFDNTGAGAGANPFEDTMVVEVSDDGGTSWTELETVGPTGPEVAGGWFQKTFAVQEVVNATDEFRIRFIVSDRNLASIVEAGVDGVELLQIGCEPEVPGDIDGDGVVGINDFLLLLGDWGPCAVPCPPSCAADLDDDCLVGIVDFLLLLANWTELES